jgi:hypothetical protein
MDWTDDLDRSILRDCEWMLTAIRRELQLHGDGQIRVSAIHPNAPTSFFTYRDEQAQIEQNHPVMKMLERHGVVSGVVVLRNREGSYAADRGQFLLTAQIAAVGAVLDRVTAKLHPQASSDSEAKPAKQSDPFREELKQIHRVERAKLPYKIIVPIAVTALLALGGLFFAPVREWVSGHWSKVIGASADSTKETHR